MKTSSFLTFISIILTVYTSVNYYIFIRGWQALSGNRWVKVVYLVIFVFLFLSYIAARVFGRYDDSGIVNFLNLAGSVWLAAMLYFFIAVLLLDLVRLSNYFFHFLPVQLSSDIVKTKLYLFAGIILTVTIVITAGIFNARNPVTKEIVVNIPKNGGNHKSLRIAVATDLHIGHINHNSYVDNLITEINELKPDMVLLPGDILDEDVGHVIKNGMGESFRHLNPKLGVWAVTGNHEYISGVEKAVKYIESIGIKILRDTSVLIDNSFYLIGREDRDKKRFTGQTRKNLSEITKNLDNNIPKILLDHQPHNLQEAESNKIDLQLSGHTHHGQLWPLNYITGKVYEKSWGYLQKGSTSYYISCGYGTWGPPVRTGNRPELILLTVNFQ